MIVTFKSNAAGDVIYFKDVALKLLALMGRDEKVPSALYAEDISDALVTLENQLLIIKEQEKINHEQSNDNDRVQSISLNTRAEPLIKMLQKSLKKQCPVHWE